MFGLLNSHKLVFQDRADVGGGVWSFAFRAAEPLGAQAGQHGLLQLSGTALKPFSLASAPEEDRVLIGTSLASGSGFKTRLAALSRGQAVTLRGPVGQFTLDDVTGQVVLLAQGVGITPLRSLLGHIALSGLPVRPALIHVSRGEHAYRDDTERWAASARYPQDAGQFRAAAADAARSCPSATFYVAGAPAFVTATTALLRESGVARGGIRQDKYLFYKPGPAPAARVSAGAGPA